MKTKQRKFTFGVVLILFVVAIATGPGMVRAWREKKVVDRTFAEYSSALVSKDFARAYEHCSNEFRSSTTYDDFIRQQTALRSTLGELKSIKRGKTVVEGRGSSDQWAAVLHAELVFQRGTAEFIYEFHRSDNGWQLFGYKQL